MSFFHLTFGLLFSQFIYHLLTLGTWNCYLWMFLAFSVFPYSMGPTLHKTLATLLYVDSGSVYDIYLPTHVRKNPHSMVGWLASFCFDFFFTLLSELTQAGIPYVPWYGGEYLNDAPFSVALCSETSGHSLSWLCEAPGSSLALALTNMGWVGPVAGRSECPWVGGGSRNIIS